MRARAGSDRAFARQGVGPRRFARAKSKKEGSTTLPAGKVIPCWAPDVGSEFEQLPVNARYLPSHASDELVTSFPKVLKRKCFCLIYSPVDASLGLRCLRRPFHPDNR